MKKVIYLLMAVIIVSGCMNLSSFRARNREKIVNLSRGLTKQQVVQIMGTRSIDAMGYRITNPYKSEVLRLGEEKGLEILYYYTETKRADNAITDDELTPLIFDQGELTGWGWNFLEDIIRRYGLEFKTNKSSLAR